MISNCGYQRYCRFPTTPQPHRRIYRLGMGMVCHGTGTVQENPTCRLPILNPSKGTEMGKGMGMGKGTGKGMARERARAWAWEQAIGNT